MFANRSSLPWRGSGERGRGERTRKKTIGIQLKSLLFTDCVSTLYQALSELWGHRREQKSRQCNHYFLRWSRMLKRNTFSHFNQSPKGEEPHKTFQVLGILCNQVVALLARTRTYWGVEAIAQVSTQSPAAVKGDCCRDEKLFHCWHPTSMLAKARFCRNGCCCSSNCVLWHQYYWNGWRRMSLQRTLKSETSMCWAWRTKTNNPSQNKAENRKAEEDWGFQRSSGPVLSSFQPKYASWLSFDYRDGLSSPNLNSFLKM